MGTKDQRLALQAIAALRSMHVPFALLHADSVIDNAAMTDLDLVVDEPPASIVDRTHGAFGAASLVPVLSAEYDIGGTCAVWYARPDATDGVQVDFLYDPEGVGRLGLRTRGLMKLVVDQEALVPQLSQCAELLYLWRKGGMKKQLSRLEDVKTRSLTLADDQLRHASLLATGSSRAAKEMQGTRAALPPWMRAVAHPILRTARLSRRIRTPAGFWVHTASQGLADDVWARFGGLLSRGAVGKAPGSWLRSRLWYAAAVLPVRLRPGLYISYGMIPPGMTPDFVLGASNETQACIEVVRAMNRRLR